MSKQDDRRTAVQITIASLTNDQLMMDQNLGPRGLTKGEQEALLGLAQFLAEEAYGEWAADELRALLARGELIA